MKITKGKEGLTKTWQKDFPETTKCCRCSGEARIGFVAHEGFDGEYGIESFICSLHKNEGKGNYWLHDACAVAVYFCKDCLETTALYNQG
jgi:hypothetical protein